MKNMHAAPVNIAPERSLEFDAEYPDYTLEYRDTSDWECKVNVKSKYIVISRRVAEVVWCAAYGYIVFYFKEVQGRELKSSHEIDLNKDLEVHNAMLLLRWVYKNWLNGEDTPWPQHLPCPVENPEEKSFLHMANELFLCSMAYVIHHELAHIRLRHIQATKDVIEEREADYSAADWIMSIDEDNPNFVKRALGIAVALEVLTSYGIHTKLFGDEYHPPSYDRLIHTLRRFLHDDDHKVWAVVIAAMKLHLDLSGTKTPDIEYDNFLSCAEGFANTLADFNIHK